MLKTGTPATSTRRTSVAGGPSFESAALIQTLIGGTLLMLTPLGGRHHILGEVMIISGIAGMVLAAIGLLRRDQGKH